ncbi:MAG: hypothetical protein MJ252_17090, partial [archaeon]|nr:hypothetical protein [archaeon]
MLTPNNNATRLTDIFIEEKNVPSTPKESTIKLKKFVYNPLQKLMIKKFGSDKSTKELEDILSELNSKIEQINAIDPKKTELYLKLNEEGEELDQRMTILEDRIQEQNSTLFQLKDMNEGIQKEKDVLKRKKLRLESNLEILNQKIKYKKKTIKFTSQIENTLNKKINQLEEDNEYESNELLEELNKDLKGYKKEITRLEREKVYLIAIKTKHEKCEMVLSKLKSDLEWFQKSYEVEKILLQRQNLYTPTESKEVKKPLIAVGVCKELVDIMKNKKDKGETPSRKKNKNNYDNKLKTPKAISKLITKNLSLSKSTKDIVSKDFKKSSSLKKGESNRLPELLGIKKSESTLKLVPPLDLKVSSPFHKVSSLQKVLSIKSSGTNSSLSKQNTMKEDSKKNTQNTPVLSPRMNTNKETDSPAVVNNMKKINMLNKMLSMKKEQVADFKTQKKTEMKEEVKKTNQSRANSNMNNSARYSLVSGMDMDNEYVGKGKDDPLLNRRNRAINVIDLKQQTSVLEPAFKKIYSKKNLKALIYGKEASVVSKKTSKKKKKKEDEDDHSSSESSTDRQKKKISKKESTNNLSKISDNSKLNTSKRNIPLKEREIPKPIEKSNDKIPSPPKMKRSNSFFSFKGILPGAGILQSIAEKIDSPRKEVRKETKKDLLGKNKLDSIKSLSTKHINSNKGVFSYIPENDHESESYEDEEEKEKYRIGYKYTLNTKFSKGKNRDLRPIFKIKNAKNLKLKKSLSPIWDKMEKVDKERNDFYQNRSYDNLFRDEEKRLLLKIVPEDNLHYYEDKYQSAIIEKNIAELQMKNFLAQKQVYIDHMLEKHNEYQSKMEEAKSSLNETKKIYYEQKKLINDIKCEIVIIKSKIKEEE